jgi:hypothetical protein
MSNRWSTVRRHDDEHAPGLDLSRGIVLGFLIAAGLGLLAGAGWLSYLWVSRVFAGH